MKFIKYLLLLILVGIVGGLIYVAMQPSNYSVSRSKTIKAPISTIFNTINNLKTWEKWGPWHDEDSTIAVSYGDKTIGLGANYSWTSKDGPGSIKTIKVTPNKLIEQKMQFADYNPTDIIWKFEETDEATKITWQIKEEDASFIFKMMAAAYGGWDKMLGTMEAKGLDNLEKIILEEVKMANSFRIGTVSAKEMKTQKFIGFHHKMKINHEELSKIFMRDMPKAGMYAMKNKLQYGDYTPGSVYTKWDEEAGETEFYVGLLLHKELKPSKEMVTINLPEGKIVTISKFGNYGNGDVEAHTAIGTFLKSNNLEMRYPIWELYVNDPTMVKPQEIQTDIYYPVK